MVSAPSRDLRSVAWFERRLEASTASILLLEDRLLAGDWDGHILCWDLEGDRLWSAGTSNRVSAMVTGGDALFAVCGRDLVCLDLSTGGIRWTLELEGSSDLVACTPDGGTVVATSSIFDLEMNDFLESTIWRCDGEGTLLRSDAIDERPWSISMRDDGVATLALGRPRCGIVRAEADGLHHMPLEVDAPATCGLAGRERNIIGHADGSLTAIEDGLVREDELFPTQPGPIEALACTPHGLLVGVAIQTGAVGAGFGGATGLIRQYDADGRKRWQVETPRGEDVEHLSDGPDIEGEAVAWSATWDGTTARLHLRSETDGRVHARFDLHARTQVMTGNATHLALGFADGEILLLEGELLNRRLASVDDGEVDEGRAGLAARLRALRGE